MCSLLPTKNLFILVSVNISWFILHDWYFYWGGNIEGRNDYFSFGLLKRCNETGCYFNPDGWSKKIEF
ncbi:hypothetical protein HZS_7818 [Henneguya salminicola]|nr:hypothetical protein HZS_7818 [Henneguya salminicola]